MEGSASSADEPAQDHVQAYEEGLLLFNSRQRHKVGGGGENPGYSCQLMGKRMTYGKVRAVPLPPKKNKNSEDESAEISSNSGANQALLLSPQVSTVKGYAMLLMSDGKMQVPVCVCVCTYMYVCVYI